MLLHDTVWYTTRQPAEYKNCVTPKTAWKKGSLRIDSLWAQELVTTAITCGTRKSFEAVSQREGLDIYAD
jgi:hypothetical protein